VKPTKPREDVPFFPHSTKRWAKKSNGKINGRACYFGSWDDPDAESQKYLNEKDDLYAGPTTRVREDRLVVK
jgi:hypothetical protein